MSAITQRGAAVAAAGTALALALGALAATGAAADDEQPYAVTVSDATVTIGDRVEVAVAADRIEDVYAYSMELGYDPALLAYVGDSAGTEISGATYERQTPGEVVVTHTKLGTSPATTGDDVTLVTATFTAIADGTATVTASDLTSVTSSASSTTTPVVGSARLAIARKAAPVATSAPSISGTARVGSVLAGDPGRWDVDGLQFAYQWSVAGVPVAGATGPTFRVPASAAGDSVTLGVTASRTGYETGTATASSAVVARASTRTSLSASPRTLKPGRKLTTKVRVSAPGVVPTGTLTYTYRGRTVRQRVALVDGRATITFRPEVGGRHTLAVRFVPSKGFGASTDSVRIRVRR
ncbi:MULTISPECIES: cohesin domain-containing protein [Aeromicrobium]|uniref:cohesin domain-containing protein n=1 Tax=Aeromicrobium TaxID=2040 RepID=UPI000702350F|nr:MULTISPECIES: cohesin domain-containing protein [Aeromicrobium]KQX74830.1 hypothetical protein ASD10_06360 [Aeromicrobium sp. Root472D3]MCL8251943.1 cohesin domain-containing protein [Aeromicrobium fastidiosum]